MQRKESKHYFYRKQEFWAQNGLIYLIDYRDETPDDDRFEVISAPEFVARAIQLNELIKYWQWPNERNEMYKAVEDMISTAKAARKQGDPTDPKVAKQLAWENRKTIILNNYNPSKILNRIIPGSADYKFDPGLPLMPQAPEDKPIKSL